MQCLSREAETQGKGSVLAVKAVETQGKCIVLAEKRKHEANAVS